MPPRCCSLAALVTGATLVWFLVITAMAIAKLVEFGFAEYIQHFTNWTWTLSCIFYGGTLCFSLSPYTREFLASPEFDPKDAITTTRVVWPDDRHTLCNVRCAATWIAIFLLPLIGLTFFVALAVFVLLLVDPTFVTDLFAQLGPGVVMVANDVYHVVPCLALLFFVSINHHLVWYALNRTYRWAAACGTPCVPACCVCASCGANVVAFLLYLLVLRAYCIDVEMVYGDGANEWLALLAFIVTGLAFVGVPLALVRAYTRLDDADPRMLVLYEARAMLKPETDIFSDAGLVKLRDAEETGLRAEATAAHLDVDAASLRRRRKAPMEYGWP